MCIVNVYIFIRRGMAWLFSRTETVVRKARFEQAEADLLKCKDDIKRYQSGDLHDRRKLAGARYCEKELEELCERIRGELGRQCTAPSNGER
jgi:hypothetical protein